MNAKGASSQIVTQKIFTRIMRFLHHAEHESVTVVQRGLAAWQMQVIVAQLPRRARLMKMLDPTAALNYLPPTVMPMSDS